MRIGIMGRKVTMGQFLALLFYYGFCTHLPHSRFPVLGPLAKFLRYCCCRRIFRSCGRNVNVERRAFFYSGAEVVIGDDSGIGVGCCVPDNIVIGRDVMMGPHCYFVPRNHRFDRTDIPMRVQGYDEETPPTVIEDDVWFGRNVFVTCGRTIRTGTVLAGCCVLTRDFPAGSVVGGNPGRLLKNRRSESGTDDDGA